MRKKVLSTILCLTTGLSVLVGCGSTTAETTTESPTSIKCSLVSLSGILWEILPLKIVSYKENIRELEKFNRN